MSEENTQETAQGLIETTNEEVVENQEAAEQEAAPEQEAKPEAAPEDQKFAAKFAALSRREKALRQKEREIEQRMAEIESKLKAQEPAPAAKQPELPLELRLKKDPFNTLKELGLDYDVLAQVAKNNGKITPELQMEIMREELRREYDEKLQAINEKLQAKEQEEQVSTQERAVQQFKSSIAEEITKNAETYEFLSLEGEEGIDLVYEVIENYYKETDEIMPVEEALKLVEEQFEEEAKSRLERSKKIKKFLGTSAAPTQQAQPPAKVNKTNSVTLTNAQTQASSKGTGFMSDDESKREAAKLIRWVE